MSGKEHWAVLVVNVVVDRPAQVRYQRIVALAKYFNVVVITAAPLPDSLSQFVKEVHIVTKGWQTARTTVSVVKRLFAEGHECYVHTQYSPNPAIAGYLAKTITNCKWIYDLWDHPSLGWVGLRGPARWIRKALWSTVLNWVLPRADAWVIGMHPAVLGRLPPAPVTCRVILTRAGYLAAASGEGSDSSKTEIAEGLQVTYVGPVTPQRGLPALIAWANGYDGPPVRLYVAGRHEGSGTEEALRKLEEACAASRQVDLHVIGELAHADVLKLLLKSDIGLCPTDTRVLNYRYAYPIKVMEYMSMGLIVVATEGHGTRTLIEDGVNGFVAMGSDDGFCVALSHAIEACAIPGVREAMRNAALSSVAAYEWGEINARLMNDVRAVLAA